MCDHLGIMTTQCYAACFTNRGTGMNDARCNLIRIRSRLIRRSETYFLLGALRHTLEISIVNPVSVGSLQDSQSNKVSLSLYPLDAAISYPCPLHFCIACIL
jgi:hypothetical protein